MRHILFFLFSVHCIAKPLGVIFLDIDGVLVREWETDQNWCKVLELFGEKQYYTPLEWSIATAYFLNPGALQCLDQLISDMEKTHQVAIVLSSAWRENGTIEEIQNQMFAMWPFSQKIIDKTVHNGARHTHAQQAQKKYGLTLQTRADQIDYWLKEHLHLSVDTFVILDDWDDDLSHRFPDHFIHVKGGVLSVTDIEAHSILHFSKIYTHPNSVIPFMENNI